MKLNDFLKSKLDEQGATTKVASLSDYEIVKNPKNGTIDIYMGNSLAKQFPGDMKEFGQWLVQIFRNPEKAKNIILTLAKNPDGQKLFLAKDDTPDITKTGEVNIGSGNK